jgi:tryptophan synthase beta chain
MVTAKLNSFRTGPDETGSFGIYGGRFVAETLMPLILELEQAYKDAKADPAFQAELDSFLEHYVGRPSIWAEPRFTSSGMSSTIPAPTRSTM